MARRPERCPEEGLSSVLIDHDATNCSFLGLYDNGGGLCGAAALQIAVGLAHVLQWTQQH